MQDLQASKITSKFALEAAGVRGLLYPFRFLDRSGDAQSVTGRWSMSASVEQSDRGTHMSRMIALLDEVCRQDAVDLEQIAGLAANLQSNLGASQAAIDTEFQWFRRVAAPVSGQQAMAVCKVGFNAVAGANPSVSLRLEVAAKSLCPCSKAISDRGAHNQRSLLRVRLEMVKAASIPSLEHLVSDLEKCASSPVYPILKRADEKFITEHAYDHPVFVEDIVRNIAGKFCDLKDLRSLLAETTNLESIHAHDCFARISWSSLSS